MPCELVVHKPIAQRSWLFHISLTTTVCITKSRAACQHQPLVILQGPIEKPEALCNEESATRLVIPFHSIGFMHLQSLSSRSPFGQEGRCQISRRRRPGTRKEAASTLRLAFCPSKESIFSFSYSREGAGK